MKKKVFFSTTGALFAVIAVLHFLRLTFGWDAVIGGWHAPTWVSGLAIVLASYLSYQSFKFRKSFNSANSK